MAEKESAFGRIGKRLTPEKLEEMKQERLKDRASLSLASQLGYYVGEEIVRRYLPTISVDSIHTNTNISVTCAEGDECRRLRDTWRNSREEARVRLNKELRESNPDIAWWEIDNKVSEATETEWKALRAYHEMLEEKYLPKTVECHFSFLNVSEENMQDFKEAIGGVLWDCDCSHYLVEPENIDVKADEDGYFTIITLKRG